MRHYLKAWLERVLILIHAFGIAELCLSSCSSSLMLVFQPEEGLGSQPAGAVALGQPRSSPCTPASSLGQPGQLRHSQGQAVARGAESWSHLLQLPLPAPSTGLHSTANWALNLTWDLYCLSINPLNHLCLC